MPRHLLHEDIRSMLCSEPLAREGYEKLCAALVPDAPRRDVIADRPRDLCISEGATAALVDLLTSLDPPRRSLDELDQPFELSSGAPKGWTPWQLYVLEADLRTMALKHTAWDEVFTEARADVSGPARPGPNW